MCHPPLGRQSESTGKQLEEARVQMVQLKREMEAAKRKHQADLERAEIIAQGQRDALEREMSDKLISAERSVSKMHYYPLTAQKMRLLGQLIADTLETHSGLSFWVLSMAYSGTSKLVGNIMKLVQNTFEQLYREVSTVTEA